MKETIEELIKERESLWTRIKKIDEAIKAFQAVCKHPDWEDAGRDSHKSYKKCTICGYNTSC